jgi:eukaryotic-like serine/threonine-protein kinase
VIFSSIFGDSLNLWQISISPRTWQVIGTPRRLTSGAGMEAQPSVAARRLVFAALSRSTNVWGLPIDANSGKVLGDIGRLTEGAARDTIPSLSIDGKKLTFWRTGRLAVDIWLKDLESGHERRLVSQRSLGPGLVMAGDGSRVFYPSVENQKLFLYAVSTNGGEPEKVCRDDCGVVLSGASHDGGKILPENLRGVILVDTASGQKTEILKHPHYKSSMGRFSPDDRWISFHLMTGSATRRIFIAPFRGAVAVPESEWIPITNGQAIDRYTWWSPDGNLLYFISERDGFVCLWAQRLDPETKHPRGAAFPIRHFHAARRLLGDAPAIGMSVGAGRLVFSMTEQTGNIWMTNLP